MAFQLSALPRLATALLAGIMLGLAGLLAPAHPTRSPLAESATLGVASGAQLEITLNLLAGADVGHGGSLRRAFFMTGWCISCGVYV
ncbi:MAG: hypothetical protein EON56_02770 [Alphaproteobacteria bacterium]|nr:MAG: hypothetical protein EON56_02770 [Alphaproteobacteria bacterium]